MKDKESDIWYSQNPAIIIFTHPNPSARKTNVNELSPRSDKDTHNTLSEASANKFLESRSNWTKYWTKRSQCNCQEKGWQDFVKLNRTFRTRTALSDHYVGWPHHCEKTEATNKCSEPCPDNEKWIQHCFSNQDYLGYHELFVEFVVDWEEWEKDNVFVKEKTENYIDNMVRKIMGTE